MKLLKDIVGNPNHIAYNIVSILSIVVFSIVMLAVCVQTKPVVVGEFDDYMLSTVALQNHFTFELREDDVERAKVDFPEYSEYLQNAWDNRGSALFCTYKGKVYPYYFGTYSAACIPAKVLLKLLGGSQSRAFPLTNIASWIAALLVTFFFLKRSRRTVLITLLLLMCAPIFPYYFWPSAEMFLYALVTCGAVFLVNQQFKLSALFISVAGTLNATVMAFGFFVIILFVYQSVVVFKKVHDRFRPVIFVKENVKRTLLLAACYIPFVVVAIFNTVEYGGPVPQMVIGQGVSEGWGGRFWAHFFDLNIGFVLYVPLLLVALLAGIVLGLARKKLFGLLYVAGFLLFVLAYSRTWHINSGSTGISRYNAWALPILVLYATAILPALFSSRRLKMALAGLLAASCVVSGVAATVLPFSYSYLEFSPVAKYVMNTMPASYHPVQYIFWTRALGYDMPQGTSYRLVAYSDDDGYVRKLFVAQDCYASFAKLVADGTITGSREDLDYLLDQAEKLKKSTNPYEYINLPPMVHLVMAEPLPQRDLVG